MLAHKLLPAALLTVLVGTLAITTQADAATPFGPVDSRDFYFHKGTAIERPTKDCGWNFDWLLVKGPGLASKKSVDVTPAISERNQDGWFPSSGCTAPDCLQLLLKVTSRDPVGPRTVTIAHADGRKVTTTFDVVENTTGRCDAPKGKK